MFCLTATRLHTQDRYTQDALRFFLRIIIRIDDEDDAANFTDSAATDASEGSLATWRFAGYYKRLTKLISQARNSDEENARCVRNHDQ